jgi:sugar phosphate permease
MAMATMGLSSGGFLAPIPLALLITGLGWRGAWVATGAVTLVLGTVASLVMRRQPEDYGLLPDGDPPVQRSGEPLGIAQPVQVSAAAGEVNLTSREAVRTSAFWLLIVSSNLAGMALMGINIHLVSYLLDRGFGLGTATGIVTFMYAIYTVAKPVWGVIVERLHVRYCLGICYVGGGVGVLLLLWVGSVPAAIVFSLVYGLTRGAQSLLMSLAWADYFGRASLGGIRGISVPFRIFSGAGGPLVAGILYDVTGGYTLAFVIFALCFWAGALAMVLAKPPQMMRPIATAAGAAP